jgi:hypothetical protein
MMVRFPLIIMELLGNSQVTLPIDVATSNQSHRWYARFANRVMLNPVLVALLIVGLFVPL